MRKKYGTQLFLLTMVLALCDLGLCYESGDGVEADPVRAAELYLQAAEQDYAPAQCNLGVCYLNGIGVETDPVQAAEWLRRAADLGFARAQSILGV